MPSTNLAPDTVLTIRTRRKLAANTSACRHPDTQSNKKNEDTAENAPQDVSQIHPTDIVNPSSPEPESPTDSILLQDREEAGPPRVPSTTSEETGAFEFVLGDDFRESFLSAPDSTADILSEASGWSRPDAMSDFNFSAMQKREMKTSPEPTPAALRAPITNNLLTTNDALEGVAKKLLQVPFDKEGLYRILPDGAFDRYIEDPGRCTSLTKAGNRCKNKIRSPGSEVLIILGSLTSLNPQQDWKTMCLRLEWVIQAVLCGRSHQKGAITRLLVLDYRMDKKAKNCGIESDDDLGAPVTDAVRCWLKLLCRNNNNNMIKLRESLVEKEKEKLHQKQPRTPDRQLKSSDSPRGTLEFEPYRPRGYGQDSLPQAIQKVLLAPLSEQDLECKYLYIFWSVGTFGHIKIGISKDITQRLTQWDKCVQTQEHFQGSSGQQVLVNHAHRVERLVQTELREVRVQHVNCAFCNANHSEWFTTSAEHGRKVIQKYVDFMAVDPYLYSKEAQKWILGQSTKDIQNLCEPIVVQVPEKTRTRNRPLDLRNRTIH